MLCLLTGRLAVSCWRENKKQIKLVKELFVHYLRAAHVHMPLWSYGCVRCWQLRHFTAAATAAVLQFPLSSNVAARYDAFHEDTLIF